METIIGTMIGIICGYIITARFYKKGMLFEKHMYNISHSIEEIYLNTKFPSIFLSQYSTITSYSNERPSNKDIPHLAKVGSETNKIGRGKELFILFRLIDEGLNLPLQSGVKVINGLNGYNIPISFEGFGWCSCKKYIPIDAPIGSQKLFFEFEDEIGNRNKQEYIYQIIDTEP